MTYEDKYSNINCDDKYLTGVKIGELDLDLRLNCFLAVQSTTPYTSVQQHTLSIFSANAAFCELYLSKKVKCCMIMTYTGQPCLNTM